MEWKQKKEEKRLIAEKKIAKAEDISSQDENIEETQILLNTSWMEIAMRRKYIISRDVRSKQLTIREFAVIDKNIKKPDTSQLKTDSYVLLCQETYESEDIVRSISKGMHSLISSLRTLSLFPIETTIFKIAESVAALYSVSRDESVELLFDDTEFFSKNLA